MPKYTNIRNNMKFILSFSKGVFLSLIITWGYFLEKLDSFLFVTCIFWDILGNIPRMVVG